MLHAPDPSVLAWRPASFPWREHAGPRARVSERGPAYEDEGSSRTARGVVAVDDGAWWSASLTVPVTRDATFLRVERHGTASVPHAAEQVDLVVRTTEVEALLALLAGVVAQARRDGVLQP